MSTVSPRSEAISAVRSTGNPNVSYSLNASEPLTLLAPAARVSSATFWKSLMPRSSVRPKLSSSSAITAATRAGSLRSSGNASPIDSATTGTSPAKKPGRALSICRSCGGIPACSMRCWPAVATMSPAVSGRMPKLRLSASPEPWRRRFSCAGANTTLRGA